MKQKVKIIVFILICILSSLNYMTVNAGKTVNVCDYGAKGDGVSDDTEAINSALSKNRGKEIFFPAGVYLVSGKLNIYSDTTVRGEGASSVILAAEGKKAGTEVVQLNEVKNVIIENICISGNSAVNNGETYDDIDGIHIFDMWNVEKIQIRGCYFIDNIYCAIRIFGGKDILITESTFLNVDCGVVALGENDISNMQVTKCYFKGHGKSEAISLYGKGTYDDIEISSNVIEDKVYGHGIWFNDQSKNSNISIIGNRITNCAVAISAFKVDGGIIQDNTIIGTTNGRGMEVYNSNDICVTGNVISNTKLDSISIKSCKKSEFSYNNIIITNNAQDKNMAGIKINDKCKKVTIINNEIKQVGNSTNEYCIYVNSTGSVNIKNNLSSLPVYISPASSGITSDKNN